MNSSRENFVDYLIEQLLEQREAVKKLKEELETLKEVNRFYQHEWLQRTTSSVYVKKEGRVVCDCGELHDPNTFDGLNTEVDRLK